MFLDGMTSETEIERLAYNDLQTFGCPQVKRIAGMWVYENEEVDADFVREYKAAWRRLA